ncbi:hypothetical protein [Candidatus Accumulibacter aalborgensis]|uniref:hypothetical protein n=1 Tax=Candidatus Accumulibacter aalborgensis TaxID=1860102 RepID=UPI00164844E0|nr:hypothetical protein [Candidatus Accumulibacter aalborgensis]
MSYLERGKPELAEQAWQVARQTDTRHIEAIYNYGLYEWRAARLFVDRAATARSQTITQWWPTWSQSAC